MAWHGMGRGKTLSCLWEAREQMAFARRMGAIAPKFMVFCPNSAVHTWRKECYAETPDLMSCMYVFPYSQLHNAIKTIRYHDYWMVIDDESHALKSADTDRVKAKAALMKELGTTGRCFQGGRIILATGTPLPNHAAELYTSWAMCGAPTALEAANRLLDNDRFERWRKTFANKEEMNWVIGKNKPKGQQRHGHGVKYSGVKEEGKLQALLSPFVHFRAGGGDLPQAHEFTIDLQLDDDSLLQNADIEKPEYYMAINERLSRAKTPYMIEWVKDFMSTRNEQLLVFAMNRYPLLELKKAFPKQVELVVGPSDGMTNAQRNDNLTGFQNGKIRVLGMTYACGAESHNLQNAWCNLYHGYPWNDAKRRQAMARTNRTGQQMETLHYFLMSGQNDYKILGDVIRKGETERRVESLLAGNNKEESLESVKNLLAQFI